VSARTIGRFGISGQRHGSVIDRSCNPSIELPGQTVDYASQLSEFSAATVVEASQGRSDLPPAIKPIDASWRVCGPAFTVETAPGHNIWIHRALYRASPGDVLVVAVGQGFDYGYWGEILTEAAVARQLGGLVIDGCVRDAADLVAKGFPVFARGLCVRGTGKDASTGGGLGGEVTIGDVTVRQGDIVVGDVDGVVVVPASDIVEVATRSAARVERERDVVRRLRHGNTTLDVYGW
jgi:4-hydroxy-4-methyl-2-oxoglutarate aldolase